MPSPSDDEIEIPFPALDHHHFSSYLSPNDAFITSPRHAFGGDGPRPSRSLRRLHGDRSTSRRRKRPWKKLMWVKQSYPDNYTDQATFLEHLQRNPRLKPYDFWPLVADSTVVLQHVCSVIIFIVCFICIFQERVSPTSIVSWSSIATFLGWLLWERWVTEEEDKAARSDGDISLSVPTVGVGRSSSLSRRRTRAASIRRPLLVPMDGTESASPNPSSAEPFTANSTMSLVPESRPTSSSSHHPTTSTTQASRPPPKPLQEVLPQDILLPLPGEENRTHQRLGTLKSAFLIHATLLGLSPILKSLTRSTSSDSIWAISFWLLTINIFFFDYSGGVGAKFPASLSTNAALMASTVLASRLPSTEQVFSLALFSIEVFGLFPVFRRYVRHRNWRYHVALVISLVFGAGLGVGMVFGESKDGLWPWKCGISWMILGSFIATLVTGGSSYWLLQLQRYKLEIRGPWDPARPIVSRRQWVDK